MTRSTTTASAILATVSVAAGLAGCGSSSPTAKAGGGSRSTNLVAQAYKYARCMRAHGVTDFPDPVVSNAGHSIAIKIVGGASPAMNSAQSACKGILPNPKNAAADQNTPAHTHALLAFARCLRSHGFPNFPDPNGQGQLTLQMISAAGISLHQPAVLRAGDACAGVTHGVITAADVAQAVERGDQGGSSSGPSGSGGTGGSGG